MVNKRINNHPPKNFGNKDQEMVGILVGARDTEQDVHGTDVFFLETYIMYD